MTNQAVKSNPRTNKVFDDLEAYLAFCRDYGYRFDERDLYNSKSYVYRQFQKFGAGTPVKNQWEIDLARFKEAEAEALTRKRG